MRKVHKERLLKLATFLRTVDYRLFDLDTYISDNSDTISYSRNITDGLKKLDHKCGTTACAIGFCPVVFPKSFQYTNRFLKYNHENPNNVGHIGREFFGLNECQYEFLFMPSCYGDKKGPKTVANRIEQFVKNNGVSRSKYFPTLSIFKED